MEAREHLFNSANMTEEAMCNRETTVLIDICQHLSSFTHTPVCLKFLNVEEVLKLLKKGSCVPAIN